MKKKEKLLRSIIREQIEELLKEQDINPNIDVEKLIIKFLPKFDRRHFKDTTDTYAGSGLCSICRTSEAVYMSPHDRKTKKAYCLECAKKSFHYKIKRETGWAR